MLCQVSNAFRDEVVVPEPGPRCSRAESCMRAVPAWVPGDMSAYALDELVLLSTTPIQLCSGLCKMLELSSWATSELCVPCHLGWHIEWNFLIMFMITLIQSLCLLTLCAVCSTALRTCAPVTHVKHSLEGLAEVWSLVLFSSHPFFV
jgi:hypothetical protein